MPEGQYLEGPSDWTSGPACDKESTVKVTMSPMKSKTTEVKQHLQSCWMGEWLEKMEDMLRESMLCESGRQSPCTCR